LHLRFDRELGDSSLNLDGPRRVLGRRAANTVNDIPSIRGEVGMAAEGLAPRNLPKSESVSDELLRRIDSHTARQVQDLRIDCDGSRVTVTGRSRTYYIKQLVTQAILNSMPAMKLANEIAVY